MPPAFHLQPLLDLASTRTDEAARKLGELVAAERDVEQKLKMLEDYRAEYHERFVQAARDGLSPDAWRNYSAFIAKLDDAIAAQRKVVEQSRARRRPAGLADPAHQAEGLRHPRPAPPADRRAQRGAPGAEAVGRARCAARPRRRLTRAAAAGARSADVPMA